MIPVFHYIILSCVLFSIGVAIVLVKRNSVIVLAGIELILNAANINLVAFSTQDPSIQGQLFALFIMVVAAAEATVALAILIQVYRHFRTINLDEISQLKD